VLLPFKITDEVHIPFEPVVEINDFNLKLLKRSPLFGNGKGNPNPLDHPIYLGSGIASKANLASVIKVTCEPSMAIH